MSLNFLPTPHPFSQPSFNLSQSPPTHLFYPFKTHTYHPTSHLFFGFFGKPLQLTTQINLILPSLLFLKSPSSLPRITLHLLPKPIFELPLQPTYHLPSIPNPTTIPIHTKTKNQQIFQKGSRRINLPLHRPSPRRSLPQ